MKTTIKNTEKKTYHSPQIERITLDNEISLVLQSPAAPPVWPSAKLENTANDPFKSDVG